MAQFKETRPYVSSFVSTAVTMAATVIAAPLGPLAPVVGSSIGGGVGGATSAWLAGGSTGDILQAGFIGALAGAASGTIPGSGVWLEITRGAVSGAVSGGVYSAVSSGNIFRGALYGGMVGGISAGVMHYGMLAAETVYTTAVNVFYHNVFLIGPRHTNLRLYPDDPASVASRHNVTLLTDEAGRSYYVLGAGPENGMLVSAGMRETDLHTYPNSLAQGVKTPDGMTNDEFIGEIIENSRSFRNGSHNYDLFPEITPGEGYNSNSYVSGLLQTSGGSAEKPSGVVPGWRTPAPFGVRQ